MTAEYVFVEKIIRDRRTEKVLATLRERGPVPAEVEAKNKPLVRSAIETAGWAPFHYPLNVDGIAEPWRAHILWNAEARELSRFLSDELKLTSKEPMLAGACSALVLINWIPETAGQSLGQCEDRVVIRNEEHLAATAAMVQSFLIALTALGMGNYWSSGGKLRGMDAFDFLGIPTRERLLAAVFIEYPEMQSEGHGEPTRKPGALREKRGDGWIREVPSCR
ncbi:MAG: nitroreductase [Coraliomargarita sp.]